MRIAAALSVAVSLLLATSMAVADGPLDEPDDVDEESERQASAEPQVVFSRADDLAALQARYFSAGYAIESGKNFGQGAEPFGIKHRVQLAYGVTDWLKLSLEQNMKHKLDTQELRVGVIAPQARLTLAGMFPDTVGQWPLDLSAYGGPRVRIMGRRAPSAVFGFGANTPRGPFHFTVNEAAEITVADPEEGVDANFGPRYDLGVGYELGYGFVAMAEVWGHAAWSAGGYIEQEHHAGPGLLYVYDIARFGLGGGAGWRDQRGVERTDLSGRFTLGLEI